jgi:hypothetical protein
MQLTPEQLKELGKKFKELIKIKDENAIKLACDLVVLEAKKDFVENVFPELVTKGCYFKDLWELDYIEDGNYEEILKALYGGNMSMKNFLYSNFRYNYGNYVSEDEINKAILEDPEDWLDNLFYEWYHDLSEEEEIEVAGNIIMKDVRASKVNPLNLFEQVYPHEYLAAYLAIYDGDSWVRLAEKMGKLEQLVELVNNKNK